MKKRRKEGRTHLRRSKQGGEQETMGDGREEEKERGGRKEK